jgi:4,5-dihydroxyphthalate decarboxylase
MEVGNHGGSGRAPTSDGERPSVHVTLAINDYDHVRDLCSGAVSVPGVALTCLHHPVEEIFYRFTRHREWHVSELSLAKYCSLRAYGDDTITAIPVFPSRAFRHSAIFIRADGPADDPAALRGGRIGIPEWTQTATVYARGLLEREYGVGLRDVTWVQAGTNEPGRSEGVTLELPEGVRVESRPEDTLNDLLASGELDAVIAAHPPTAFKHRSQQVRRLFSDPRAVEEDYFARTGVFPIMHVVAVRADLHAAHPWIAMNLFTAFEESKRRSQERAFDVNAPRFPIPWQPANAERAREIVGDDPWPYGIDANRTTLEAFVEMCVEQGVCARPVAVEDLFAPETHAAYRI